MSRKLYDKAARIITDDRTLRPIAIRYEGLGHGGSDVEFPILHMSDVVKKKTKQGVNNNDSR